MQFVNSLLCAAALAVVSTVAIAADQAPALTEAQKTAVEEVVRNLLTKKEPDIIVNAAKELQMRQEAELQEESQKALGMHRDKLYNDPSSPVGGNPKGDVAVVEFYDYQCGYCKMAAETVAKLVGEDKNVKIVYKEFPILGAASTVAAKASLASNKQGKFLKFHEALLTSKERLSDDVVYKIAKSVGLNIEKLKKDMADPAIEKSINENIEVGHAIGAHGTPSFVINDQVHQGAPPIEKLKQLIQEARNATKK